MCFGSNGCSRTGNEDFYGIRRKDKMVLFICPMHNYDFSLCFPQVFFLFTVIDMVSIRNRDLSGKEIP